MNDVVIVDASVLLAATIGDNKKIDGMLRTILHDTTRSASILSFTAMEFANGVRFSTRDVQLAKQALELFAALSLSIMHLSSTDIQAIVELSYRLDTTVYDTAYHYAALIQNGVFITCDHGYFKKASPLKHIELWG